MLPFEHALLLLLLVTGLSIVARWLPWPRPITYVIGGVAFSFWAAFPRMQLDPEFFFVCFLPPLLFSDGWLTSLREFAKARRPILLLSTGLVVLTTVVVGIVAHWLLPGLPLAMGFALGAVVSPTDAVAVSAITERLRVPTRLTTILEGESLMNDATGLVAFKFALGAVILGTFSLRAAAQSFVLLAAGGLIVGLSVGYLVGKVRDLLLRVHGTDSMIEITVSLLTPYAAYLAAEHLGVSGVLGVVAAGLYSGWRDPVKMDAETRRVTWTVWSTLLFWLNGLAFVLLGLQFRQILVAAGAHSSVPLLVISAIGIAAVAMVARIAWFFPGAFLPYLLSRRVRETEELPSWKSILVGGWAGMRGAVTLAAALSIPLVLPGGGAFPGRDIVIFLAFGVILTTLFVQGTTTEWLIHKLGLREDGLFGREERLARTRAVDAGLKALRDLESSATGPEEAAALGIVVAEYEYRLSELVADGETRTNARRRRASERHYRLAAVEAERVAVDALWRSNVITDAVHRPLQYLLDSEEAALKAQPAHHDPPPAPLPES